MNDNDDLDLWWTRYPTPPWWHKPLGYLVYTILLFSLAAIWKWVAECLELCP